MSFLHQAGVAVILVLSTLSIQCAGMAVLIDWGMAHFGRDMHRIGPVHSAAIIVRTTGVMIALHMLQILLWAAFYRWKFFPSWEAAFYFSTTSYSTVGCGDLVLPRIWRVLGAVESVTGVLMCGLSASFLFAVVTRLVEREARFSEPARPFAEQAPAEEHSIAQR